MTVTKDIVIPNEWAEKFDLTVRECSGALAIGAKTIASSIVVMNGIRSLKKFFHLPEVKELIEMSQDNRAGFLTDRSPAIIARHNANPNKRYDLKPYTYEQVIDALLPCLLEGYRPHGNEINIISGTGMPVKNGKHNKIIELTDSYLDSYGTPAIKDGYAFIKCKAKWKIGDNIQTLGYDDGDELHIKIPFGKYDSIDKVLGLAESKIYTRVLRRITGRFMADEPSDSIDITDKAEDLSKPSKPSAPPKKVRAKKEHAEKKPVIQEDVRKELALSVQELKDAYDNRGTGDTVFKHLVYEHGFSAEIMRGIIADNDAAAASSWMMKIVEFNAKQIKNEDT